jgi:hypothetical protein
MGHEELFKLIVRQSERGVMQRKRVVKTFYFQLRHLSKQGGLVAFFVLRIFEIVATRVEIGSRIKGMRRMLRIV